MGGGWIARLIRKGSRKTMHGQGELSGQGGVFAEPSS
jgi:hypothetical protein